MLCHEHAHTSKLPYLDAEYSFQGKVEADAEEKIESLKRKVERRAAGTARGAALLESSDTGTEGDEGAEGEEDNAFLPGLVGAATTSEEEQLAAFLDTDEEDATRKRKKRRRFDYCLPFDFKEVVHSKPPAYHSISANRCDPHNRPKRHPPSGETCQCRPAAEGDPVQPCGGQCLNHLSYVECVGNKTLKSGDKNPYWNCNCGPGCGNRAVSQREFAKCRPAREHGKGWGLIAINGVKKDDVVQEYVGEIIDEKTKEERLKAWAFDHPNDPNFYVMHLEPGWYIDAREVANMARFINHSCDPNCKLVPVNVAGHMRVSIVCTDNVPPGGFLSYDYQFDTRDGEKFTCRCGAANCRGTMQGRRAEDRPADKKSKKQLFAEAKARRQRDKKFLHGAFSSARERLHLTGPFVPGARAEEAAPVAGGPRDKDRREARGVFLWRNARDGGDFSSRYWTFAARQQSRENAPRPTLASRCARRGGVDAVSCVNSACRTATHPR